MPRPFDTDVLVVGAGPAGLTLSALLARAGVASITVTRHADVADAPRAHVTNQRTMEVLRDLGVEREARAAGQPYGPAMPNIVWATSFAGPEIARVRARGAGPARLSDYALASPCATWNVPQHRLEPLLLGAARAAGADIRFGQELTEISEDPDGASGTLRERGSATSSVIRARWLVGADGGSSTVAEIAGFEFEGRMNVKRAVNVWVDVDLSDRCAYRPANIYGIRQAGRDAWMGAGLWVCATPWSEWVVSRFLDGDTDPASVALEQADVRRWLHACIGEDRPLHIRDVSTWAIHDAVATSYRRGRVLLAGDAAHRHPPVNGLGTNTAIQDSYNLAWKLALVTSGVATEQLLDTYTDERRAVGRQVVRRSWKSAENSVALGEAFGLTAGQSKAQWQASLDELWGPGRRGRARRDTLRATLAQTEFQFNALGVELGQRYSSGAALSDVPAAAAADAPEAQAEAQAQAEAELNYQPSTAPGSYLPHAWIEHDRTPISTLDIPHDDGFTLLVGVEGEPWIAAAHELARAAQLPIHSAAVGYRLAYDDVYGDWQNLREVDDAGCVLVRPDRYIAWRSPSGCADPGPTLERVMRQLLRP